MKNLLALAALLLMPMGVWAQKQSPNLRFIDPNNMGVAEVVVTQWTVNWSERSNTAYPGFEKSYGIELGDIVFSSSDASVATLTDAWYPEPKAPGSTTITATFAGNDTYEAGSASFTLTYTDDRSDPSAFGYESDTATGTYGGSVTEPNQNFGQLNASLTYSSSNPSVATFDANNGLTIVGAGTTVISAAFEGNDEYKPATFSYTLTINPATLTASGFTAGNKTYDGTTDATLSGGTVTGLVGSDVVTVSATGAFADVNVGTGKTVSISGLTLGGADAGNYELDASNSQASTTADITAKALTVTAEAKSKVYGETDPALTYTSSGLVGNDQLTGSLAREAGDTPGTYYITQGTLAASDNYTLTFTGATFTITTATMTGVSATGFSGAYDGQPHGISVTAPQGATVTYGETADSYGATAPTLTDVGSKAVYYKVSMTGYDDVTGSADISITAREVALSWSDLSFTYDGLDHVPTATVSNLVSGDACTVTVTGAASTVGEHTATATALSNSNYSLPASATQSFTISTNSMSGVSATGFSGTYDGDAHGISVSAPEGATVLYRYGNGAFGEDSPTFTDAGTYTVDYLVSMEGYDDETGSATVEIAKANGWVYFAQTAITTYKQRYFESPTVEVTPEDASLTFESSNPRVATVDPSTGQVELKGIGTTTITATFSGNNNYTSDSHSYNLTVEALPMGPIEEDRDYSFGNASDFLNDDGSDKPLKGTIINDMVYMLDVAKGDGYDSEDHSIAITTPTTPDDLKKGVENLGLSYGASLVNGMAPYDQNNPNYQDWLEAQGFSGMLFFVDPPEEGEVGELTIESKEETGCQMAVQAGASETTMYQHNERNEDIMKLTVDDSQIWKEKLKVNAKKFVKVSVRETVDELLNRLLAELGMPVGIANFPFDHFARTKAIQKGKKSASNVKVFSVSYRKMSSDGINTVGNETRILSEDGWYDLRGQRIAQPQKKGLYINNGRKVVVR